MRACDTITYLSLSFFYLKQNQLFFPVQAYEITPILNLPFVISLNRFEMCFASLAVS